MHNVNLMVKKLYFIPFFYFFYLPNYILFGRHVNQRDLRIPYPQISYHLHTFFKGKTPKAIVLNFNL